MSEEKEALTIPLPVPKDASYIYPLSSTLQASLPTLFRTEIIHPALIIPAKQTAELRRVLSHVLMRRPKIKDVYGLSTEEQEKHKGQYRKLVLKLCLKGNTIDSSTYQAEESDVYTDPILSKLLSTTTSSSMMKSTHTITLTYEHYTVEETLSKLLPPTINEIPSAFEIIGHVAHLNLRPDVLPYKYIIGQVILDKNKPRISIVVNKIGNIENEFRTFPMEIIASTSTTTTTTTQNKNNNNNKEKSNRPRLEVQLKEEGSTFKLDFEHVYWNSRLQFEHKRLVRLIANDDGSSRRQDTKEMEMMRRTKRHPQYKHAQQCLEHKKKTDTTTTTITTTTTTTPKQIVVADVMAGVGPFAIPLTSQYNNVTVHANDLNPTSFHYLKLNSQINHCNNNNNILDNNNKGDDDDEQQCLKMYNMDGRAFVRYLEEKQIVYHHVIMNLPANAIEFLDVFRGWKPPLPLPSEKKEEGMYPMIHVHCFASKEEEVGKSEALARIETALQCKLDTSTEDNEVYVHIVRDVSPKKNMLCVSFRLPKEVSLLKKINLDDDDDGSNSKEDDRKEASKESKENENNVQKKREHVNQEVDDTTTEPAVKKCRTDE
uniref:tRNA (guanine(37)-N1)-methyltransferase n=1 Tax=Ditylum brightwellii TaxID=49249 RepID=A0A7S2E6T7_9STRA|mmetsp:Transcript_16815/g.24909  ORF Transcript_16815/g.24909 Transcript_16815/m.24909 type:complete len:600 (+) Transcript_16815:241-2040(+)